MKVNGTIVTNYSVGNLNTSYYRLTIPLGAGVSEGDKAEIYIDEALVYEGNITVSGKGSVENISISAASIEMENLTEISSNNNSKTFNFTIVNYRNETLTNINWSFDLGESIINSTSYITLGPNQTKVIQVDYNYTDQDKFTVTATTNAGVYTDSISTSTIAGELVITLLNNISSEDLTYTFEVWVKNNKNTTINNVYVNLTTGEANLSTNTPINLSANETAFFYFEYNYSERGNYTVNATAYSDTLIDYSNNLLINNLNLTYIDAFDLIETYSIGLKRIFEFKIKNNLSTQMNDISWIMDFGDGYVIQSTQDITLQANETIFNYGEYEYNMPDTYTITVEATDGFYTDRMTINTTVKEIEVTDLAVLNFSTTKRIFEFFIINNLNNNLTNVSWRFDTKNNLMINSTENIVLTPNQKLYVYIDYNYTQAGTYNVNATAINGSLKDSRNITINVS